ncbi:MAG TPA: SpoIID/LytB domain-containing protein [Fredinandcohnia sp.]|nr:SpoIID/LytB domain-containing protein [Fredinandcohnia sp.]
MRALAFVAWLLPALASAEPLLRIAVYEGPGPIVVQGERLRVRALDDDEGYAPVAGGRLALRLDGDAVVHDGGRGVSLRVRADGPIAVGDARVRGSVEVLHHEGRLLVVNEIPMETYLAAVLGSEMMPSFHPEALKAQAVASRTYSLRKRLETADKPYDLGSTVLAQVYEGIHREDPRTRAAVEATAGEVLVWEHEPIEAYFFSSCGGRTATGEEALGRALPYLVSVSCDEAEDAPRARWDLRLEAVELGRRLGLGRVDAVRVERRTTTGRAESVHVQAGGAQRRFTGAEFRRRIGYGELRSLAFEVERRGGAFVFRGRGFGHGAGMCQWGAQAAALGGKTHREILEHYYPGAELRKMY